MSSLKVNQILDQTGSTTIQPSIPALETRFAKAWVNFNGTGTVAIRKAYNVSSITDNGVGDYTVNFTTPMADANFAVTGTHSTGNAQGFVISALATTSFRVGCWNLVSGGTPVAIDPTTVTAIVFD